MPALWLEAIFFFLNFKRVLDYLFGGPQPRAERDGTCSSKNNLSIPEES